VLKAVKLHLKRVLSSHFIRNKEIILELKEEFGFTDLEIIDPK
jgi:hypothetical protein